ncbi:hypothetical protein [uncultured Marinobacter sp.]|uniref:hypothetical protein n=1 Tax=uncultured Marinobacter sp. TaxID=187379 RepID=UPI00258C249F|nr:hypothetical protein [uncultured Marinobacter sp.]
MTELFSKFFLSKITATNAATVCLCVVVMLIVWPWVALLASERLIPEKYIFPLFGLATLAFSYLSIRCIIFLSNSAQKLFGKFQNQSEEELRRQHFEENVRIALPALDKEILWLLARLKESEITVDLRGKGVTWLLREKWIYKAVQTSAFEFVAKLDPSVKRLLNLHEQAERSKVIMQTIENMRNHHREFLGTFWADVIPFGTPASGTLMSRDAYSAGHFLVQKGLLKISKITGSGIADEVFSLTDDAEAALREQVYRTPPKRKVVKISLKFVQGSGASGGGAIGCTTK